VQASGMHCQLFSQLHCVVGQPVVPVLLSDSLLFIVLCC
jgi:hypothetical protein